MFELQEIAFGRDAEIMDRVYDHYNEALKHYPEKRIVGIFLYGSQNYKLDTPTSDVDTKLVIVPSFEDIALNRKPISTTIFLDNNEHMEVKDIRLYCAELRKQSMNFLETIFTPYCIVNPIYQDLFGRLVENKNLIARLNPPYRNVKTIEGMANNKYYHLEEGDTKSQATILRLRYALGSYISGSEYQDCLVLSSYSHKVVRTIKNIGVDNEELERTMIQIHEYSKMFYLTHQDEENQEALDCLLDVQKDIVRRALMEDMK